MVQLTPPQPDLDPPTSVTSRPVTSRVSPVLRAIAYPLCCDLIIPFFFGQIDISGQENLPPGTDPIILAPTHRSRWDALIVPYAAGWRVTGRDLRFMVSANEVKREPQGWFIRRLGGFPVDPEHPGISSLRHGVELLQARESLVIFPEGNIMRDGVLHPLKSGLARLALQAESSDPSLNIKIVPIYLTYSQEYPTWGCGVQVKIGQPLAVSDYQLGTSKASSQKLTTALETALNQLKS